MGLGHIASPAEALVGVDGTDADPEAFGEGSLGTPVTFWIRARAFSKCSFNSFIRSCETSRKAILFGPKCLHRYQSQTQDSKQIQNCGHIVKKKFIRSLFSPASSTGNLHQVVTGKIWGIKITQESTEI